MPTIVRAAGLDGAGRSPAFKDKRKRGSASTVTTSSSQHRARSPSSTSPETDQAAGAGCFRSGGSGHQRHGDAQITRRRPAVPRAPQRHEQGPPPPPSAARLRLASSSSGGGEGWLGYWRRRLGLWSPPVSLARERRGGVFFYSTPPSFAIQVCE